MSNSRQDDEQQPPHDDDVPETLDADEVGEEIITGDGEGDDVAMDSDDEVVMQNDSIAFFDGHKDSVFAIAQHPKYPSLVVTGGSEGDEDDAPGKGFVIDTSAAAERPVLPASFSGAQAPENPSLDPVFSVDGHTDSINTLAFTLPNGDFLVSGGLDGRLRAYSVTVNPPTNATFKFVAEAQEVPEINWVAPCPSPDYQNSIALGASDGSVWVYTIDPSSDPTNPLQLVNTFWLHTGPCTAGAWTPDGALLATVSEDSSLYVWDVWGLAASKGVVESNGQTVVSMNGEDQRFEVEGGLYSLAIEPNGAFLAVGGAGGQIRVVSLPRLTSSAQPAAAKGNPGRSKTAKGAASQEVSSGGQIIASLQTQSDSIETLSFVCPGGSLPNQQTTLLAAGSVDGGIAIYDATRRFAVRRNLVGAHEDFSVVKVEFVPGTWLLTSCGMDGVVRRFDLRGGGATAVQNQGGGGSDPGLLKEWKGHRGDGEGGGVLGFVQGATGERIVTAGDDGLVLVFEA